MIYTGQWPARRRHVMAHGCAQSGCSSPPTRSRGISNATVRAERRGAAASATLLASPCEPRPQTRECAPRGGKDERRHRDIALLPIRLTQLASKGPSGLWLIWSCAEPQTRWVAVMESSKTRADAGPPATPAHHKM